MDQLQQLINIIKDKNTSTEKLRDLLKTANDQLVRYNQALGLLDKTIADNWKLETYQDILSLGSGGNKGTLNPSEWGHLLPDQKMKLRADTMNTLQEGKRTFEKLKSIIEIELSKREGKKTGWQFWKK